MPNKNGYYCIEPCTEIKILKERLKCKSLVLNECSLTGKNCIGIKECLYKHQLTLIEIRKIALESCLCCGECKSEFSTKSYCDFNEIIQKTNEVLNG